MIYILLGSVTAGVILACILECKRRKREKEAFKQFVIDASELDI